jgi:small subunit ribosomal protein S18
MYQNNKNAPIVQEKKLCHFCQNKIEEIDYKETRDLRRFLNSQGKIYPPKRYGTCSKHQRSLTNAIKKARQLAMLPFVIK